MPKKASFWPIDRTTEFKFNLKKASMGPYIFKIHPDSFLLTLSKFDVNVGDPPTKGYNRG